MALSAVQIVNLAFDLLKGQRIVAIGEATANGRRAGDWYEADRDALLSRYPWTFAMKRASLSAHATDPAFGWAKAYPLPADCLTPWQVDDWRYPDARCAVENHEGGRALLTDLGAPLRLRYVARIENAGLFHPLFAQALVRLLAFDMCFAVTGSMSARAQIEQEFDKAISAAFEVDAISGGDAEFVADDWISARL